MLPCKGISLTAFLLPAMNYTTIAFVEDTLNGKWEPVFVILFSIMEHLSANFCFSTGPDVINKF